ncbi:MAG: UDP-N-acetylmuramate--L-alanine ligase [Candidatus Delongbacteria bacterium]|jgi:UDP-N-acetylmuramate--alanine ligase|nr:UDP-N-acetylmuramate--L-alanine ligase [Candidatus Delongbacteria bacterium]
MSKKLNKKIHFIGIGGAGMMPLAIHCKKLGYDVVGSDLLNDSFNILNQVGIFPIQGHTSKLEDVDIVIYSAAVKRDNYEYTLAKVKELELYKRAEFLGQLTKASHSILISGSHGKSTTSVMLADMLYKDPDFNITAIIGAESVRLNSNYYEGDDKYLIVEADEYDKSFLKMYPKDLIVLNIDNDHLDIYGDINGLIDGFKELISKLNEDSFLIHNADDDNIISAIENSQAKLISFGLNNDSKYKAINISYSNFGTEFDLMQNGIYLAKIEYTYSGKHNVYNMLSCLALLAEYGFTGEELKEMATNFKGLKRRQEIIYKDENIILMDDYAHHPTEVLNSLDNIRENHKGRIVVMFQPHLFSRTKEHLNEFAKCFEKADKIFISHIYPAREKFDPSITSKRIYDLMDDETKRKSEVYQSFEEIYERVSKKKKNGDLIVSMGAGDINKVIYKLKSSIVKKI